MELSLIRLSDGYRSKQEAREQLAAEGYTVTTEDHKDQLSLIREISFRDLFVAMNRRDLTLNEAFVGMCYVLRATNAFFAHATEELFGDVDCEDYRLAGREFLSSMAMKESKDRITAEEVAGLVMAAHMDLVVRFSLSEPIVEICGTGGDIGFPPAEKPMKTINVSTLSAIVLASLGIPTMKHGSYANTSAVGSTDAIERFGVIVEQTSFAEMNHLLSRLRFHFSDAHVVKTIHDLSHLPPRHETINHVIGPMTPPVSSDTVLHKIMGVNEKIHPITVARAFELLHRLGAQNMGNAAILTGLDAQIDTHHLDDDRFIKNHAMLDELSPHASVVAFMRDGSYLGCHVLKPSDFGLAFPNGSLALENRPDILQAANERALAGRDPILTDYLAMNAALALFVVKDLSEVDAYDESRGPSRERLRMRFEQCKSVIMQGHSLELLRLYAASTGGAFRSHS